MGEPLLPGHAWQLEVDVEYLHYLRVEKGMTVAQFAEALGVPAGTLQRISDTKRTTLPRIAAIASALDIEPGEFLIWYQVRREHVTPPTIRTKKPGAQVEDTRGEGVDSTGKHTPP